MKQSDNKLYVADNLDIMHGMNSEMVDLIYSDPPFNSKRIYSAPIGTNKGVVDASFHDIWVWSEDVDIRLESFLDTHAELFVYIQTVGKIHGLPMKAYLTFMAQRIIEMHRVLKITGSLYLHCDPTASHYLKIILDYAFGKDNFRNEIIWNYGKWSNIAKYFQRNHDCILFYAKSADYTFNPIYVPKAQSHAYHTNKIQGQGQLLIYDRHAVSEKIIKKYINKGYKIVDVSNQGVLENDTWSSYRNKELNFLNSQSKERTKYPTQKPLALLDRIIKASSNEGDLVMDPFCGCATTCVAAQNLHRNWIGIDVSDVAVQLVQERLTHEGEQAKLFSDFLALKTPPARTDQEKLTLSKKQIRGHLYGKQNGYCNGCKAHFEIQHFEIDHIFPASRGGAWVLENLQLLCSSCNRIKGDRPMEYLQATIKARTSRIQFF